MSKNKKQALVPKLRFPEFRDAGEWEEKKLGDVCEIKNNLRKPITCSDRIQGIYPYYGSSGIVDYINDYIFDEKLLLIGEDGAKWGAFEKSAFIADGKYWVNNHAHVLKPIKVNDNFLENYLVLLDICPFVTGAAPPKLTLGKLKEILIPVPKDTNEQQRIADCLSSLDELIAAEAGKLDAYKAHKKALMQQLFPHEGDTVPKLRFPEFREAGEWEKQKISNLLVKISNPVKVELDKIYQEIGIRSHGKGIFHKEPINGKELGNKRVFWVEENAFIVNIVFAWELAIATTTENEKGMIASHRFPMYKAYENKAVIIYIKYFFLTNKGKELLWIASPGGAGRNKTLGQKEFENLEFIISRFVEEQRMIADCLSSLDELITAQGQKVEALKTHKRGLMQGLFPSNEDIDDE